MADLKLPLSITGKKELIKVERELERLHEKLIEAHVVSQHSDRKVQMPQPTDQVNDFLYANDLTLNSKNIKEVIDQVKQLKNTCPILKVSFAVEPEASAITKILGWFRKEIDPTLLITVGVQPSIAGGCIVQTPSKHYDFSLRKHILNSQDKFKAVVARDIFHKDVAKQPKQEPAGQEAAA